jgi:hypothetical protein
LFKTNQIGGTKMALKKLPVGIEKFDEFFTRNCYYVDKTGLIAELLENCGKVNLFTRPRRFGKSLNMQMFKSFFEIGSNNEYFNGLKISQETELCKEYMGQYPIIYVSLKDVILSDKITDKTPFESARNALKFAIGEEAQRFSFLEESDKLTTNEKKSYEALIAMDEKGEYTMTSTVIATSLKCLSKLLMKHYGKKTIILIDEYDVPLDKAFQYGYYDEMVSLIRSLFSNALKSNDCLEFAILTGCLRISRESIFTGMNNFNVMSITDKYFSQYFGFTEEEVKALLEYYGCGEALETTKKWYDGYRFGDTDVYCPWDVIKFCQALVKDKAAYPQNYWANTSGNDLVRRFVDKSNAQTKSEIEQLINGETVIKQVNQELTYREIDDSIENLWSVLFTTGYLTQRKCIDGRRYELAIPNLEVKDLFITEIEQWFKDTSKKDNDTIRKFCEAFPKSDIEQIEKQLNKYLWNSISIRDTAVKSVLKENFYHGLLLGILQYEDEWIIKSNAETGIGYGDIIIKTPEKIGIIIELKYAEDNNLDKHCKEALAQIEGNSYDAGLLSDGMEKIIKYGIAFYKKNCKVTTSSNR